MATTKAKTGNIVDFDAAKLTGSLGNLDGSQLTNIRTIIKQSGNPSTSTNPTGGVGTMYVNTSNGATFCCTDSTTNANIWMNVGEGSGNIIQPTNPNDNFPDMQENTSVSHTFTGSSDDDTVVSHVISDISSDKLTVNDALVADGQPHVFNAGDVDADLNVTFIVKTIDNDGVYSTGRTITVTIHNDEIPVAPADNGSFPDLNKNDTYNHLFTGGTDDNGVTHYLVENISDAAVTVTNAEVAAGNAHSFVTTNVGAVTPFTFTLKAKDTIGQYSTPVTYTSQVNNVVYTVATGGVVSAGTVVPGAPDYKYHVFNSTGNFTVSQVGTDNTVEYLVIAGGGAGGYHSGASAGGGGAGGYLTGSGLAIASQNYVVTVGSGGPGPTALYAAGNDGGNSVFSSITAIGGGGGGARNGAGRTGGSGGAGTYTQHNSSSGQGQGTPGQGHDSGYTTGISGSGGGGGAGAVGAIGNFGDYEGGAGGNGLASSITGSSVTRAGGGGGGANGYSADFGGAGGSGGGGAGNNRTGSNNSSSWPATPGSTNTGSGGGGGGCAPHLLSGGVGGSGGAGGSGVVIIRYKFQN